MPKKVLIVLVDGFEEIEAVTPIDILRRAGLEVVVAGLEKKEVTGSHGIHLTADILLTDIAAQGRAPLPDAVVLPGGPGAEKLGGSADLASFLEKMKNSDRLIGAICAAPAVVLGSAGMLDGKKATCFPGYEKQLGPKVTFVENRVVTDGKIVTSRAAGTALEFSLELVRRLADERTAAEVGRQIMARD